jgi:hypothetical protein
MMNDLLTPGPEEAYRDLLFVQLVGTYLLLPYGDTTTHPAGDPVAILAHESTEGSATFIVDEELQMPVAMLDKFDTQMPLHRVELTLVWFRVFGPVQEDYLHLNPFEAVSNITTSDYVQITLDEALTNASGKLANYSGGNESIRYDEWIRTNLTNEWPTPTPLPTRDPAAYPSPIQPTPAHYLDPWGSGAR